MIELQSDELDKEYKIQAGPYTFFIVNHSDDNLEQIKLHNQTIQTESRKNIESPNKDIKTDNNDEDDDNIEEIELQEEINQTDNRLQQNNSRNEADKANLGGNQTQTINIYADEIKNQKNNLNNNENKNTNNKSLRNEDDCSREGLLITLFNCFDF